MLRLFFTVFISGTCIFASSFEIALANLKEQKPHLFEITDAVDKPNTCMVRSLNSLFGMGVVIYTVYSLSQAFKEQFNDTQHHGWFYDGVYAAIDAALPQFVGKLPRSTIFFCNSLEIIFRGYLLKVLGKLVVYLDEDTFVTSSVTDIAESTKILMKAGLCIGL